MEEYERELARARWRLRKLKEEVKLARRKVEEAGERNTPLQDSIRQSYEEILQVRELNTESRETLKEQKSLALRKILMSVDVYSYNDLFMYVCLVLKPGECYTSNQKRVKVFHNMSLCLL